MNKLIAPVLVTAFFLASCGEQYPIRIDVAHNDSSMIGVTNNTGAVIAYNEGLFDYSLDVWSLYNNGGGREGITKIFLLTVVDARGGRHLMCGVRDEPPPGPLLRELTLAPGEEVRFPLPASKNYLSCLTGASKTFYWQVLLVETRVAPDINLSNPGDYSIVYESNLLPIEKN